MKPEKMVVWALSIIVVEIVLGVSLCRTFINWRYALTLTFGASAILFLVGFVLTKNELYSSFIAVAISTMIPIMSYLSLKEGKSTCKVIGRFQASYYKGQPRGWGSERIQLICPEKVYEKKIGRNPRYNLKINDTLSILESFTGFRKI